MLEGKKPCGSKTTAERRTRARAWLIPVAMGLSVFAACGGGDNTPLLDIEPAAPTAVNMTLPGIGLEVEQGLVVYGTYDATSKTVTVLNNIFGDTLYASTAAAPQTTVPGFEITVDLGSQFRTLEVITGPWEASNRTQGDAMKLIGAFYTAIYDATPGTFINRDAPHIERIQTNIGFINTTDMYCSELDRVVRKFNSKSVRTTTAGTVNITLQRTADARNTGGAFYVCMEKTGKNLVPQANYGVKLKSFAAGKIARDFAGSSGNGCGLELFHTALTGAAAPNPTNAAAFCRPLGNYRAGQTCASTAGGAYIQPSIPCFPVCIMGQLCYGMATNSIWYDGALGPASDAICRPGDAPCISAVSANHIANSTALYYPGSSAWSDDEREALAALLVFNRCAAWINSMTDANIPAAGACRPRSFWKKQAMGALPKARFDQFAPHLPAGFQSGNAGVAANPSYTTKAAYRAQACDTGNVLFGPTMRNNCHGYINPNGLDGAIGGKTIPIFHIAGDLALVVESRFETLYVAGGFSGTIGDKGGVNYTAQTLKDSVNFVREINGFARE